jgi:hypothetical protein
MTPSHVIYIPMAILLGIFLGFILGARAARNAFDLERKRDEERAAARAARDAKKAAKAAKADGGAAD